MTKTWVRYTLAVTTVLLALSLAGCASSKRSPIEKMQDAFADVRVKVESVVDNPARAAKVDALITQLEQGYIDASETAQSHKSKLSALNENYDATRADMEEQMELLLATVEANQQRVLGIRAQMLELLTETEWEDIDKLRSKALEAGAKALEVS